MEGESYGVDDGIEDQGWWGTRGPLWCRFGDD